MGRLSVIVTYALLFFSGLAGLVYQVLWMKQLGLLFGNTAHAAAATLAAFFAGLAVGSWFWGRRAAAAGNALRVYAWLEGGIALTALLYFVILRGYYTLYPAIYQHVHSLPLLLLIKFGLALLLIFPPAFCMGGTIPVMGQYLVRRPSSFGATAALLYSVNTLGAALGACLAGFFLPLWIGFRATCAGAVALSIAVAAVAFVMVRGGGMARAAECAPREEAARAPLAPRARPLAIALTTICFLSGFGVLALEVLWVRMFAQVLENSVYTFAAILVIVLLCLAAGAFISSRLARLAIAPLFLLALLVLLGGLAVLATPFVFMALTDSLQILVSRGTWLEYMGLIFGKAFLTIGPPALLLGTVFPFLMKNEEQVAVSAGRSLGRLGAVNTAGAILGSLACGFLLIGTIGMWGTMQLIGVLYVVAALFLPLAWDLKGVVFKGVCLIGLVLPFTVLDPLALPVSSVDPAHQPETIVETWQGSDCIVAVARDQHGVSIKINSHYGLGSTGAHMQEKLQADIPLLIHPGARTLFFLGMGTGITAGSALDPQHTSVERVVTCELVPDVIRAARKYITNFEGKDYTGGLFSDPRATVLAEDGRHYLMATRDRFDLVVADLFVPFRSGAGSLYTREHFRSVQQRLEPGGFFVQWLPLYQLTEYEFSVITRTMLDVFDQVSLWRNSFQPGDEVVALVGHQDGRPLPACDLPSREDQLAAVAGRDYRDLQRLALPFNRQTILFFYAGNVTQARSLFADYPVNSDDKPVIEYMAPRNYRNRGAQGYPWFAGPGIFALVDKMQRIVPPAGDPLLVNRTPANRRLPTAAAAFHQARIWEVAGDEARCRAAWAQFVAAWTDQP